MTAFAGAETEAPLSPAGAKRLNVYWTDTPPVIDGKMDDACWKSVEVAKDFTGPKTSNAVSQATEVRLAYDARNIYVFWFLSETNMDSIAPGGPARLRDQQFNYEDPNHAKIDRGDIRFFHFVNTDAGKIPVWHHFCGTPNGARDDLSSKSWSEYNPDWQCVARRGKNGLAPSKPLGEAGWTMEMRIPFAEMAEEGRLVATPQPGEQWDTQLWRIKNNPPENSRWDPNSDAPWINQNTGKKWGNVFFCGRKSGAPIPVVSNLHADLVGGRGALTSTIAGASSAVEGTCRIYREGREIQIVSAVLPEGKGPIALPYHLPEAGEYRLAFELKNKEGVFLSGGAVTRVPAAAEIYEDKSAELGKGQQAVKGDRHPAFAALRKQADEFAQLNGDLARQLARFDEMTAAERRHFAEQARKANAQWRPLQYDLNLAQFYPGKAGATNQLFAVGTATESGKLYRDSIYRGSLTDPIRLALAGNEYGSFQLAILPFWEDLKEVTVSCSPLWGTGSTVIPAANLRWFRIDYIKMGSPPNVHVRYEHDHEPDPLMPAAPFGVKPGTVGAVWVDVRMPEGTPAGNYTGTVTVTAGGQTVERKLEVRAYGFDIPKRSSLECDSWLKPYNWGKFYNYAMKYTPELHARHAAVLGRYRVSSFPGDWTFLCGQVPIYAETNGGFSFDWTTFDRYVQNALTNGTTAFWSALSCNSGWTVYLHDPETKVIDRASGKTVKLGAYLPPGISNCWDLAKLPYRENRVYREFLQAYVKHLKELGINDCAYYELFDEPGGERFIAMLKHHKYLREVAPELKLLNFSVDPLTKVESKDAIGLIDVWAPHIDKLNDPQVRKALQERKTKHGEKCWFYTCVECHRNQDGKVSWSIPDSELTVTGNYTPYCLYYRPYIALRMHAWIAWHYQLDGFLVYAMNAVPAPNAGKKPEERWPNSEWLEGGCAGQGTLVYPGPDYELIPGIRLANIRDGLEDYEYFALLRQLAKQLDPRRDRKLIREVEKELAIEPAILSSVCDWTKDANLLEAKRDRLATLITKVMEAVKKDTTTR